MFCFTRCLLLAVLSMLAACGAEPKNNFSLVEASISDIQNAVKSGQVSCRAVVDGYISRIEAYDRTRGIHAITVINPNATDRADEVDRAIQDGETLPDLFCTPLLIKDNFDTHDMVTTGGSIALKDSYPPDDAFMVRKLREAGAIVLAKTNMAEWAFSPRQTVSSSYGRTANAYDVNFVPAGSSGGTASGVAASMGVAGMGSDTGNSIRGPSSHLALFGIRSTIGLTSRDGVIPLIFDRDIAGPMARTVEDGVRLFNVVAGYDPSDPLTVPDKREADYRHFLNADGLDGKRLGVFRALVDHEDADQEIKKLFYKAIDDLKAAGAIIVDPLEIVDFDEITEAIGFCGRFRYDVGQYLKSLDDPPFVDVNKVLETGEYAPESQQAFDYFSKTPLETKPDDWEEPCPTWPDHPLRNQLLANTLEAMQNANLDALIYPTWSNPPAHIDQAVEEYKGDNSQLLVPDAGLPAVTVPMGYWQDRLPAGLQFAGRPYSEGVLIELAYAYEQETRHRRPPAGFGSAGANTQRIPDGSSERAAQLKVIEREAWGSQENPASATEHRIEKITIHHGGETFPDDRDPLQYLRALQSWSRSDKGWIDIPYHFVVDLKGTVYEARPLQYPGDTNTSYDPTGHALIQIVGDYEGRELSAAQLAAVIQLSAMLARQHDVPVSDIRGHRDYAPGETVCPGENVYRYLRDGTIAEGVSELLLRGSGGAK